MDFSFNEDQQLLRQTVREFAEQEIAPSVMEYDEKQEFPRELLRKAADLGFMGVIFPEAYGGAGLGYVEYVTVVEELSRVDGSVGISVAAHNSLCTNHIFQCGNEEQRRKYLTRLASGEWIGAWSLTEPAFVTTTTAGTHVFLAGCSYLVQDADRIAVRTARRGLHDETPKDVTPPMPSVVVRILVSEGAAVKKGQGLIVVTAMKMETTLAASYDGKVKKINASINQKVAPGDVLVEIEEEVLKNG